MNEKIIYDYFRKYGYSHNGALAMLGNFLAESAGIPDRAENDIKNYQYKVNDAVGYGLAQWTLASRKQKLLNFAGDTTKIKDIYVQLDFSRNELTTEGEFASINKRLKTDESLLNLVDVVCRIYENPAVKDVQNRYKLAINANIGEVSEVVTDTTTTEEAVDGMTMLSVNSKGYEVKVLQSLLWMHGYQLDVDGDFGPATKSAVQSFQTSNGLGVDGIVGDNTWRKLLHG